MIDKNHVQDFSNHFLKGINIKDLKISGKLRSKILIFKPEARLSWQYHHQRALKRSEEFQQ